MMNLTEAERTTLAAIADAIAGPLPTRTATKLVDAHLDLIASHNVATTTTTRQPLLKMTEMDPVKDLAIVDSIAQTLGALPADKQAKLSTVLYLFSTGWGTLLLTGVRAAPFHDLLPTEREAALQALMLSRFAAMRSLYRTLKSLVTLRTYGTSCTVSCKPNPAWLALGYSGQPEEKARPPREHFWQPTFENMQAMANQAGVDQAIQIETDVVVVGSGAGGGVVAAELAQAGHRVLVLEKASYFHPADADFNEVESYANLFEAAGLTATEDGSVTMLAGSAFGGGTYSNWSGALRLPDSVCHEWATTLELPHFGTSAFLHAMDVVCKRGGVSAEYIQHNSANQLLVDGCKQLNFPVQDIPQNTNGHVHACGYCTLGCPYGEKQGSHMTWLKDAADAGAKFIDGCHVDRVTYDDTKRVTGVVGMVLHGKVPLIVKAKTVVSACGGINTPALLLRSGLKNPNIGRNLRLHPATVAYGHVPQREMKAWEGSIMTAKCSLLKNINGNGYGALLEVLPSLVGMTAGLVPWRNNADHHRLVMQIPRTSPCYAITRDLDSTGRVTTDAQGQARMHYQLGPKDAVALTEGLVACAKVLLSQGAVEINTTHHALPPLKLTAPEELANPIECDAAQRWFTQLHTLGVVQNSLALFSGHQMGSCRMGATPHAGAVDPEGESWEVQGLYVADASLFPTASGVNPMITTCAMAYSVAQNIKANLKQEGRTKTPAYPSTSWTRQLLSRVL
ncbi:Aste57867_10993 [Aphanomyces stellatus]|uniref:Long-chain-alcohol oxidase n=1 Tax=Aphanomyces stellatus TaxID=120398 RepID=A0A485KTI1_9STRA|nr:hypothetical protein As57867_010952 [Aphanomyces stellatus]VFT87861.1 Aste57867_10993 [Aphanomyces stellatus]